MRLPSSVPASRIGLLAALASGTLTLAGGFSATAAPLAIPQVPFLSTAADPNIMLLVDNSGSMFNVVPDAPYDSATTYYTCPAAETLSEDNKINIRITAAGVPYFVADNGSSATTYAWGNTAGTTTIGGTAYTNKCFDANTLYKAMLYGENGNAGELKSGPTNAAKGMFKGNYLNWYFGSTPTNWGTDARVKPTQQRRIDIAKAAATTLVDSLSEVRLGFSVYKGGNGLSILEPIGDIASNRGAVKTDIGGLTPGGMTPLAEALRDIGEYFSKGSTGNLTLHPGQAIPPSVTKANLFERNDYSLDLSAYANPIQYFCQKNYAVIMTDGRPDGDKDISTYLQDYDGDCASPTAYTCDSFDKKPASLGYSYESEGTDYLDDVAKALYDIDLRPDLNDAANQPIKNNVSTYTIGFADEVLLTDKILPDTAANGGGENYVARNAAELAASFRAAVASILSRKASGSAIAANSSRITTGTRIYQATFHSGDWTGELLAFSLKTAADGAINEGAIKQQEWSATVPIPASRKIYTWKDATTKGVEFSDRTQLSAGQQASLPTQDLLNFLRGDTTKEVRNTTATSTVRFRNRTTCDPIPAGYTRCLGDIVNFDPLFVGALNFGYELLPDSTPGRDTYTAFRNANKARTAMVYAGANDGMLHGFDAAAGIEKLAFVPNAVFPNLALLASPTYSHRFYVDGPAFAGDAYINTGDGQGDRWRTILVATTGAGGRGVFALDVTDPDNFAANDVLWEFTDPDLGLSMSQPYVARMRDGTWVAIFGSGYNSDSHRAFLFVVDLETGGLIKKIDTGIGSLTDPNGLANTVLIPDANRAVIAAYAGDLQGKLWKFDFSGNTVASWGVAYTGPGPLFKAQNAAGQMQPITGTPDVALHPKGGYLVTFGTGRYLEAADNQVPASPEVQSFYGIWDNGSAFSGTNHRASLQQQTITNEVSQSGRSWRVVSQNPVDWTTQRGWYLDLVSPGDVRKGERVTSSARITDDGRVVFTTYIPSSQPCKPEGDSWLMQLDLLSGARLAFSVFDVNNDAKFTAGDDVTTAASAKAPASGLSKSPGMMDNPLGLKGVGSDSLSGSPVNGGNTSPDRTRGGLTTGRQSWRQLY